MSSRVEPRLVGSRCVHAIKAILLLIPSLGLPPHLVLSVASSSCPFPHERRDWTGQGDVNMQLERTVGDKQAPGFIRSFETFRLALMWDPRLLLLWAAGEGASHS